MPDNLPPGWKQLCGGGNRDPSRDEKLEEFVNNVVDAKIHAENIGNAEMEYDRRKQSGVLRGTTSCEMVYTALISVAVPGSTLEVVPIPLSAISEKLEDAEASAVSTDPYPEPTDQPVGAGFYGNSVRLRSPLGCMNTTTAGIPDDFIEWPSVRHAAYLVKTASRRSRSRALRPTVGKAVALGSLARNIADFALVSTLTQDGDSEAIGICVAYATRILATSLTEMSPSLLSRSPGWILRLSASIVDRIAEGAPPGKAVLDFLADACVAFVAEAARIHGLSLASACRAFSAWKSTLPTGQCDVPVRPAAIGSGKGRVADRKKGKEEADAEDEDGPTPIVSGADIAFGRSRGWGRTAEYFGYGKNATMLAMRHMLQTQNQSSSAAVEELSAKMKFMAMCMYDGARYGWLPSNHLGFASILDKGTLVVKVKHPGERKSYSAVLSVRKGITLDRDSSISMDDLDKHLGVNPTTKCHEIGEDEVLRGGPGGLDSAMELVYTHLALVLTRIQPRLDATDDAKKAAGIHELNQSRAIIDTVIGEHTEIENLSGDALREHEAAVDVLKDLKAIINGVQRVLNDPVGVYSYAALNENEPTAGHAPKYLIDAYKKASESGLHAYPAYIPMWIIGRKVGGPFEGVFCSTSLCVPDSTVFNSYAISGNTVQKYLTSRFSAIGTDPLGSARQHLELPIGDSQVANYLNILLSMYRWAKTCKDSVQGYSVSDDVNLLATGSTRAESMLIRSIHISAATCSMMSAYIDEGHSSLPAELQFPPIIRQDRILEVKGMCRALHTMHQKVKTGEKFEDAPSAIVSSLAKSNFAPLRKVNTQDARASIVGVVLLDTKGASASQRCPKTDLRRHVIDFYGDGKSAVSLLQTPASSLRLACTVSETVFLYSYFSVEEETDKVRKATMATAILWAINGNVLPFGERTGGTPTGIPIFVSNQYGPTSEGSGAGRDKGIYSAWIRAMSEQVHSLVVGTAQVEATWWKIVDDRARKIEGQSSKDRADVAVVRRGDSTIHQASEDYGAWLLPLGDLLKEMLNATTKQTSHLKTIVYTDPFDFQAERDYLFHASSVIFAASSSMFHEMGTGATLRNITATYGVYAALQFVRRLDIVRRPRVGIKADVSFAVVIASPSDPETRLTLTMTEEDAKVVTRKVVTGIRRTGLLVAMGWERGMLTAFKSTLRNVAAGGGRFFAWYGGAHLTRFATLYLMEQGNQPMCTIGNDLSSNWALWASFLSIGPLGVAAVARIKLNRLHSDRIRDSAPGNVMDTLRRIPAQQVKARNGASWTTSDYLVLLDYVIVAPIMMYALTNTICPPDSNLQGSFQHITPIGVALAIVPDSLVILAVLTTLLDLVEGDSYHSMPLASVAALRFVMGGLVAYLGYMYNLQGVPTGLMTTALMVFSTRSVVNAMAGFSSLVKKGGYAVPPPMVIGIVMTAVAYAVYAQFYGGWDFLQFNAIPAAVLGGLNKVVGTVDAAWNTVFGSTETSDLALAKSSAANFLDVSESASALVPGLESAARGFDATGFYLMPKRDQGTLIDGVQAVVDGAGKVLKRAVEINATSFVVTFVDHVKTALAKHVRTTVNARALDEFKAGEKTFCDRSDADAAAQRRHASNAIMIAAGESGANSTVPAELLAAAVSEWGGLDIFPLARQVHVLYSARMCDDGSDTMKQLQPHFRGIRCVKGVFNARAVKDWIEESVSSCTPTLTNADVNEVKDSLIAAVKGAVDSAVSTLSGQDTTGIIVGKLELSKILAGLGSSIAAELTQRLSGISTDVRDVNAFVTAVMDEVNASIDAINTDALQQDLGHRLATSSDALRDLGTVNATLSETLSDARDLTKRDRNISEDFFLHFSVYLVFAASLFMHVLLSTSPQ